MHIKRIHNLLKDTYFSLSNDRSGLFPMSNAWKFVAITPIRNWIRNILTKRDSVNSVGNLFQNISTLMPRRGFRYCPFFVICNKMHLFAILTEKSCLFQLQKNRSGRHSRSRLNIHITSDWRSKKSWRHRWPTQSDRVQRIFCFGGIRRCE